MNSPLKQLDQNVQQGQNVQMDQNTQRQANTAKQQFDNGLLILSEAQKRKNWEELQELIKMIEPLSMKIRKKKDRALREHKKRTFSTGEQPMLAATYSDTFIQIAKKWQKKLYKALKKGDKQVEKEIMLKLAGAEQSVRVVKDNIQEFCDDHFVQPEHLSKSVSEQQISFATQIYCDNPELVITVAEKRDVERGQLDYYGNIVKEDHFYGIVIDFFGKIVLVSPFDGNKDMHVIDKLSITEYMDFVNELVKQAESARKDQAVIKIDLNSINHKMDSLLGLNDGTATEKQDQLVLQFAWDNDILKGTSFRRHLYEHPNIQNLNYGGFDFDKMDFNLPLGPGDKDFWHDNIDDLDRLKLVDAICNVDNKFFDIKLLRTLIKEYYANRAEYAWWKGMGFDEGTLDVMRLKQKELLKLRFKKAKADAALTGAKDFTFDGRVYPTGVKGEAKNETTNTQDQQLN